MKKLALICFGLLALMVTSIDALAQLAERKVEGAS